MPNTNSAHPKDQNSITPALEREAAAALLAKKFRKARDLYKNLCKIDSEKYRPKLVEANLGLARDMLAKGLTSEAQQVLAYLKTIAPQAAWSPLELELAAKQQPPPKSTAQPHQPSSPEHNHDQLRFVDQAVLAFVSPQNLSPEQTAFGNDITAVQRALELLCAQHYDAALESVRPIAHSSTVKHWKLFLKGLVAFYRGDRPKAIRSFDELPPQSIPAKAAAPYLWLARAPNGPPPLPPEKLLAYACAIIGLSNLKGADLFAVEQLWRKQLHTRAYEKMRASWPAFPVLTPDLPGVLSEFFYASLDCLQSPHKDHYALLFEKLELHRKTQSPAEELLLIKALLQTYQHGLEPDMLQNKWERLLVLLTHFFGPSPRRNSIGYAKLAELLARENVPFNPFFGCSYSSKRTLFDPQGAIAALRKSIEAELNHLEPYLQLCKLYDELKLKSDRNRLLDLMTARFPDQKEVLLLAGKLCLQRDSCLKGLDYLERALQLDRIDPAIPNNIFLGRIQLAQQYLAKDRPDTADTWFQQAQLLTVDALSDLTRSRWTFHARQAASLLLYGDPSGSQKSIAQARALAPFPDAIPWFAHFASLQCRPREWTPWLEEFRRKTFPSAHLSCALHLWDVLQYWERTLDCDHFTKEYGILRDYLRVALRHPFSRNDASTLIQLLRPANFFEDELDRCIGIMLARNPKDPLFRFFELTAEPVPASRIAVHRAYIENIIADAAKTGDETALRLARDYLASLKNRASSSPVDDFHFDPFDDFHDSDDFDDEEDEEEDFEKDEDVPNFAKPRQPQPQPPPLPDFNKLEPTVDVLLDLIASFLKSDLARLRKNLPKDIPAEFIDLLIRVARGELPRHLLPKEIPPPPPRNAPSPPKDDPNQPSLF